MDSGQRTKAVERVFMCALCTFTDIVETFCSPALEIITLKCRLFYLPWEFTIVFLTAVHMPPQANMKQALASLHVAVHGLPNKHSDGVFIMAGDFNLKTPKTPED